MLLTGYAKVIDSILCQQLPAVRVLRLTRRSK